MNQTHPHFNTSRELHHADGLIQLVFKELKVPELINDLSTTIEFNNRFTNRAGDAHLIPIPEWPPKLDTDGTETFPREYSYYKGRIRLSTKFFAMASDAEKDETIIHEACHIADRYKLYKLLEETGISFFQKDSHGPTWRSLMRQVGYPNVSPYHCMDTTQFKNFYQFKCPCGFTGKLTMQMGGRIIKGTAIKGCRICHTRITPDIMIKKHGSELGLLT